MKYEVLTESIACYVRTTILQGGTYGAKYDAAITALFDAVAERRTFEKSLNALADKCYAIIKAWDIRRVGKLRELFPNDFPKSLREGPLIADYDSEGNWAIYNA